MGFPTEGLMYSTGLLADVFRGIIRLPIRSQVVTHVFHTSLFHSRFHIILLRLFMLLGQVHGGLMALRTFSIYTRHTPCKSAQSFHNTAVFARSDKTATTIAVANKVTNFPRH